MVHPEEKGYLGPGGCLCGLPSPELRRPRAGWTQAERKDGKGGTCSHITGDPDPSGLEQDLQAIPGDTSLPGLETYESI